MDVATTVALWRERKNWTRMARKPQVDFEYVDSSSPCTDTQPVTLDAVCGLPFAVCRPPRATPRREERSRLPCRERSIKRRRRRDYHLLKRTITGSGLSCWTSSLRFPYGKLLQIPLAKEIVTYGPLGAVWTKGVGRIVGAPRSIAWFIVRQVGGAGVAAKSNSRMQKG